MSAADLVEVPSAFVTVTSSVPVPAGAVTVSCVAEVTDTDAPAEEPNATESPGEKSVPVTVTEVPPEVAPALGLTAVTVGAPNAKRSAAFAADAPAVGEVTTTLTDPLTPDGATAVILVELLTVADCAATPPKLTVSPDAKFEPVIATDVPEPPDDGLRLVTEGGAKYVYDTAEEVPPPQPLGLVTVTLTVPADSAGTVTVSRVEVNAVTVPLVLPNETFGSDPNDWQKPLPVTDTEFPPLVGPELGLTAIPVGAAAHAGVASRKSETANAPPRRPMPPRTTHAKRVASDCRSERARFGASSSRPRAGDECEAATEVRQGVGIKSGPFDGTAISHRKVWDGRPHRSGDNFPD